MTEPASERRAIDRATFTALEEMAGADFAKELIETFLEEAPPMLADLRDALDKRDADRFRRAAHSLKSNSSTFGALALASLARELEQGGLASLDVATPARLDALDAEYARVADALAKLRHGQD